MKMFNTHLLIVWQVIKLKDGFILCVYLNI